MSLRDPNVLWLFAGLAILVLAIVFSARSRARALARFGNPGTLLSLISARSPGLRAFRAGLVCLGLAAAIAAASGPQYGSRSRVLRRRGVDVVIALDFSKSMLARDVSPSRIERSKAEIQRLFEQLAGDRVGVVAFAGETIEFPMTTDYPSLDIFLRDLGPYDMPVGGTAIGRALVASGRLLERSRASDPPSDDGRPRAAQAVVLITDGEDHEGDPIAAARALAEKGIKVFVLGVGSRNGETIPTYAPDGTHTGYLRDEQGQLVTTSLTESNERQLRQIAEATGGRYYRAQPRTAALAPIRRELGRMQSAERRVRRVTVREDRFALVLFPAFLLLVLEGLLPDGAFRRRVPKSQPKEATP